jgi:hypothetical protein
VAPIRRNRSRTEAPAADLATLQLPTGGGRRIAGLSFHAANLKAIIGHTERSGSGWTLTATLVREPANEYDPNAIAVWVGDRQIGHINRDDAADLAPLIDRVEAAGWRASCSCHLWGGRDDVFGGDVWLASKDSLAKWIDRELAADAPPSPFEQ